MCYKMIVVIIYHLNNFFKHYKNVYANQNVKIQCIRPCTLWKFRCDKWRVFDDVYGCGNLASFPSAKFQECGCGSNHKVDSKNLITATDYDCGVDPNEVSDSNDQSQLADRLTLQEQLHGTDMIHYGVAAI